MAPGRQKRKLNSSDATPSAKLAAKKAKSCDSSAKKVKPSVQPKRSGTNNRVKSSVQPKRSGTNNRVQRLTYDFFDKSCLELAKKLLGTRLVRKLADETVVSGIIVETEAYLGDDDPSAHSYSGPTQRNKAMFMPPGTAYVYNIYGTYCCMNISSKGDGHAVLLRALEPMEGLDRMKTLRQKAKKSPSKPLANKDLCNGPSKFCQSLAIDKATINQLDLPTSDIIWLEEGDKIPDEKVIVSTRIGIEGAGAEAASKPYRLYVKGNICVSKKDKNAEKNHSSV